MYANPVQALWCIFGLTEELLGSNPIAGWVVEDSYRTEKPRLAIPAEDRLTKVERLARDGQAKQRLRDAMPGLMYSVLVLRYSVDFAERQTHWRRLAPYFKQDKDLPKRLRGNPVMLAVAMAWHIRHEELRMNKVEFKDCSRMTNYRWNQSCKDVAEHWVDKAEFAAETRLFQLDLIRMWE